MHTASLLCFSCVRARLTAWWGAALPLPLPLSVMLLQVHRAGGGGSTELDGDGDDVEAARSEDRVDDLNERPSIDIPAGPVYTICYEWGKGEGRETSGRGREERAGLTQLHPLAKSHHSVENWSASATLSYNSRCPCSPQRARQRSGDGVHTAPLRRLAAGERYRAAATATATAMRGQTSLTSRSRRSAKLSTSLCVAIASRVVSRHVEPSRVASGRLSKGAATRLYAL